jgi:intracellular sulfur oxidation DsrE/DsrF family protein
MSRCLACVQRIHPQWPSLGLVALVAMAVLAAAATPRQAGAHTDEDDVVKVVYHADFADPRRFSAMLTSINNMVTTYKNDLVEYDIKIVFVAHGIRFVTDDPLEGTPFAEDEGLAERRDNLKGRLLSLHKVHGVELEVCGITRSQIGLAEDAVYEGVGMVRSGVVRIAELQRENFAYLKIE